MTMPFAALESVDGTFWNVWTFWPAGRVSEVNRT